MGYTGVVRVSWCYRLKCPVGQREGFSGGEVPEVSVCDTQGVTGRLFLGSAIEITGVLSEVFVDWCLRCLTVSYLVISVYGFPVIE